MKPSDNSMPLRQPAREFYSCNLCIVNSPRRPDGSCVGTSNKTDISLTIRAKPINEESREETYQIWKALRLMSPFLDVKTL